MMAFGEFVRRAREKHGDRYEYLPASYAGASKKTQIICPTHGLFEQMALNHYSGRGCPKCKAERQSELKRMSFDEFVRRARIKHGDKYAYSPVGFTGGEGKVLITCPDHGVFEQGGSWHIAGQGCPKCYRSRIGNRNRLTTQSFIEKAVSKHGNRYDYSKVEYSHAHANVIIICPDHGAFTQKPNAHLSGQGCPSCKHKGEAEVGAILLGMFQRVARQAPIRVHCRTYRFDFQIQDFAPCVYVEYHGRQHYQPVDFSGKGDEWAGQQFAKTQRHDRIKADWCKRNGYPLIVIPYWIEDVRSYIVESLGELQKGDNEK